MGMTTINKLFHTLGPSRGGYTDHSLSSKSPSHSICILSFLPVFMWIKCQCTRTFIYAIDEILKSCIRIYFLLLQGIFIHTMCSSQKMQTHVYNKHNFCILELIGQGDWVQIQRERQKLLNEFSSMRVHLGLACRKHHLGAGELAGCWRVWQQMNGEAGGRFLAGGIVWAK